MTFEIKPEDRLRANALHQKQRQILLKKLGFTPQVFLDNQCEMHYGIGITVEGEVIPRWAAK